MIHTIFLAASLTVASVWVAAAAGSDNPAGLWMRGDGNARVEFGPCGASVCATNRWIKDTSKGEAVGDRLELDIKQTKAGHFEGKAFDPKRKLTVSFEMDVSGASMTTRGCVVGGLICKSETWTRLR